MSGNASLAPLQPARPLRMRKERGDLRVRGPLKTQAMVRLSGSALVASLARGLL